MRDIIGQKFNRLTCLARLKPEGTSSMGLFRCECGAEIRTKVYDVIHFRTKSCGCLRTEVQKGRKRLPYKPETAVALTLAFNAVKQSAKQRSLSFDLNREDFEQLTCQPCAYCGAPPGNSWRFRGQLFRYSGLDRTDNSKGYVLDNVVPCCAQCNKAKGVLSRSDFLAWVQRVHGHINREITA